jgi:hypothetical protein
MGPLDTSFDSAFLDFNREAELVDPTQLTQLEQLLSAPVPPTDLLVISHGWNNDTAEANELYTALLTSMQLLLNGNPHSLGARKLAVLGVHWPSKRFAEEDLIPGGAASVASPDDQLSRQIDELITLFDGSDPLRSPPDPDSVAALVRAKSLLPNLDTNVTAQDDFGRLIRSLIPASANDEEAVLNDDFYQLDGTELLERLSRPFFVATPSGGGALAIGGTGMPTALGGAAGLGNLFAGIKNGARNLLNLFTYYEMKDRAGNVGASLQQQLQPFQARHPELKLHLVGHSFGGRLVSAALAGSAGGGLKVHSIALLQAAFSHWGFAQKYDGQKDGLFRSAITTGRMLGPMLVTHSIQDRAVGLAYPIASRLRRQVASGIGDENDPYGGIGRNGALKTPETGAPPGLMLQPPATPYAGGFPAGRVYNLNGDQVITAHGDVKGLSVAHALLTAICDA